MFISTYAALATWSSSDARSPSHPKRPMKQSVWLLVRHSLNTLPPTPSRDPAFQMTSPAIASPSAATWLARKPTTALLGMDSIALRLPRRLPLRSMYPTAPPSIAPRMAVPSTSAQVPGHGFVVGAGDTSWHDALVWNVPSFTCRGS